MAQYFWPETVGSGTWLYQLARDLVERGHRVTMITTFPNYPEGRIFAGYRNRLLMRESVEGIQVFRSYIYAMPHRSFWPRVLSHGTFCISSLVSGAIAPRPDIIYCVIPPLPLGLSASIIAILKYVPVVVNIQDIYPDIAVRLGYLRNRLAIRFFEAMERMIYGRAKSIVVITESFRENLLAKGVPAEKLHIVPNWADSQEIQPGEKSNSFRRGQGIGKEFLVVYSGSLGNNTCLESVVDAAKMLPDRAYQFLIIGDGVHKEALRERARDCQHVRFLPFQRLEAYAGVLAASDIQIVTLNTAATDMSLPSKILKIMASGRPVLALARPGSDLCRLVARARCGVSVNPDDPAAVAAALQRLAGSSEELEAMGRNGREFLIQNFDRRTCVSQLESVLLSACQRSLKTD